MKLTSLLILILIIVLSYSCKPTTSNNSLKSDTLDSTAGMLMPINFSDTNYSDLAIHIRDTVTPAGWVIQYMIRNDSTKYKDLYIACNYGELKAIYKAETALEMRRYFIPTYTSETQNALFFSHGCATDCSALLVLKKQKEPTFTDYLNVVDYNIPLGQIIYITDSTYTNEQKIFQLALVDLSTEKTYKITFNGICDGVYKPDCVDTILFKKENVAVSVRLRTRIEEERQTKQTKIVHLRNTRTKTK